MHTLRYLIGDEAFFNAVTRTVYGRSDPQPGNFSPVYASTKDFINNVNNQTGQNLNWFFDTYLYQASLPKLDIKRDESSIELRWQSAATNPFTMPIEVSINGEIRTLPMTKPASIELKPEDIVIIDPASKILRFEARYEEAKASKDST